jgi:SAM-dependent methyltransferase
MADLRAVRKVLDDAGYDDAGIVAVLGQDELGALGTRKTGPLLRRTAGDTSLEALIRLFLIGVPVDEAAVRRAVAPTDPTEWVAAGLLEPDAEGYRAAVSLRAYQGLVVGSDFPRRAPGRGLPSDYVMGVSPSSLSLAALTVRRPVGAVLDLGTGCGIQAFLAARHAGRVVAVDANQRAVRLARLNAWMNDLGTVELRLGDLYEPVPGERFGLIVSNPPFIVSPEATHQFLSTSRPGDSLCEELGRAAPQYLSDDGWCQFLCNWIVPDDGAWERRLAGWFEGSGCDVWVMQRSVQAIDEYACEWIETATDEPDEFGAQFDEWMRCYAELGATAIGFGLISMRRRAGSNWFRADEAPNVIGVEAGADVERLFRLTDFLDDHDDTALLGARLRLPAGSKLTQEVSPVDGRWEVTSSLLRRDGGLSYAGTIDTDGADLLLHFDGRRDLGTLLSEMAEALGLDRAAVLPGWLTTVRRLMEAGLLEPDWLLSPSGP